MSAQVERILNTIKQYEGNDINLMVRLIYAIRPTLKELKEESFHRFDVLLYRVREDSEIREALQSYLGRLLENKRISNILTDSDIVSGLNFWRELKDRLIFKLLPNLPDRDSVDYLLSNAFFRQDDGIWVVALSDEKCSELLGLLGFKGMYDRPFTDPLILEILFAIRVLSHRVTGLAFDKKVLRMVPKYANMENPFAALQDEIDQFLGSINKGEISRSKDEINSKHLKVMINQCNEFVAAAYRNKEELGISFQVHQQLMLMERLLERLTTILDYLVIDPTVNGRYKLVRFIKDLIYYNSGKSKILGYLNKATQLMAREISHNIGQKGEKYITKNSKEYWAMFRTALGGGFIVALACIIKLHFSGMATSIFINAVLYSLNYAFAFIAIYLLHFTLATKQPAMTAARLAQVIEADIKQKNRFEQLAIIVARVFRSQFIAFAGNAIMAFMGALGLVALWGYFFGFNIPDYKAEQLITELSVTKSPALLHAAIAGIFLFYSGIISGRIYNRTKYRRVPDRINEHPMLKLFMKSGWRKKLSDYYERNMGSIAGNFWFGVFMGSTASVGLILGLNLDIRHITFAAGNFGLGLYAMDYQMSWQVIVMSIVGIGLIGLINFIVSFTLSLLLALRSRGVPFASLLTIFKAVRKYFFKKPHYFFYPPKDSQILDLQVQEKIEEAQQTDEKISI